MRCLALYDDKNKSLLLTDAFEVHFIELPKFQRIVKDVHNPLHRWLMYLDENLPDQQLKELIEMDFQIRNAEELLLKLSTDEDTFRLYQAREHSLMERNSLIADGIAKGIEQGIEKGIEKGKEEGIELERNKIISKLLESGLTPMEITKLTGYSEHIIKVVMDKQQR